MDQEQTTETQVPTRLAPPVGDVELALFNEQQRLVDVVFAQAKDRGWCYETITALSVAYPNGSSAWSDGAWRNTEGYDVYGFDAEGYSTEGYNEDGYDRKGLNRRGETYEQARAARRARNGGPEGCTCSLCR